MSLQVHALTNQPTLAWKELSKVEKVIKIKYTQPKHSAASNKVKGF